MVKICKQKYNITNNMTIANEEGVYSIPMPDKIYVNEECDSNTSHTVDVTTKIALSWHNINVFVKPKKKFINFGKKKDVNVHKQLLFNVCGEAKPGQLLAIMGTSGAGKTTLLNVLTNRNLRQLNVEGQILVNGQNVGESIVRLSAYIRQDDLFIGTLTVREHLVFQALLRMDKHHSYEERMKRVEAVLDEFGLTKCADTMIGTVGRLKGISGGERKRLAFASEIITNPSLLFCDEPTSGLDAFMAENAVTALRHMVKAGRTIVCVIHQPSSEVFELFDDLFLMAEGRVAYSGRAKDAIKFFERVGLCCPVNYNPADFYIHNLAIIPGREEECKQKVTAICDQYSKEVQEIELTTSSQTSFIESLKKPHSRYKANWFNQFKVVLRRSWISVIREPMLTKVKIYQSMLMGLMFGLVFFNQKNDEKGIMNMNGSLFILILNRTFTSMLDVIHIFGAEQPLFLREHANGMYRIDVYFLCKTLAETPFMSLVTAIMTVIAYWMIGFNREPKAFIIALVILLLVSNTAASFGYLVSAATDSLGVAISLGSSLLVALVLFGGFYLNAASIPIWLIWFKYVSWFYYSNEALTVNQWKDVKNITCSTPHCPPNGAVVLESLGFYEENLIRNIIILIVLMVILRTLACLALLFKSSRRM